MKRIIALITLVSMLALALVGCGKLDVEDSVKALKAKGMREGATYESDEELELADELFNAEIEYMGGDFTVRVDGYTSLVANLDFTKTVEFITFSSKREAEAYVELYLKSRGKYSESKIAKSGSVVVITNLELVEETLDLEFK